MSVTSFIKSTKGKVILATVVVLHVTILVAKPSFFKSENSTKPQSTAPKYLPEN